MRLMVRPHHTAGPPLLAAASDLPLLLHRHLDAPLAGGMGGHRIGSSGRAPWPLPPRETSAGPLSEAGLCDSWFALTTPRGRLSWLPPHFSFLFSFCSARGWQPVVFRSRTSPQTSCTRSSETLRNCCVCTMRSSCSWPKRRPRLELSRHRATPSRCSAAGRRSSSRYWLPCRPRARSKKFVRTSCRFFTPIATSSRRRFTTK